MFPDLVKAIIVEGLDSHSCFKDHDCVMSTRNPYGIPAWKIFSFHWWHDANNPLGHRWTLSPHDRLPAGQEISLNNHIGYSVEPRCQAQPFIPHSERKSEGYVMAKKLSYFSPDPERAWDFDFFAAAARDSGLRFLMGAENDTIQQQGTDAPTLNIPAGVLNLGLMPQATFYKTLSKSRVLIGVGTPRKYVQYVFGGYRA